LLGVAIHKFMDLCSTNLHESSLGGHFLRNLDGLVIGLLNGVIDLTEHDFDVGRLGGVLSDATVRPVGAAASGGGLVALGVADDAVIDIEPLGFGVGDGVEEQVLVDGCRLHGPSSLITGGVGLLGHSFATDSTREDNKRNDGLVIENIVQMFDGLVDLHALGVGGDFAAVLEMDTEVGPTGL